MSVFKVLRMKVVCNTNTNTSNMYQLQVLMCEKSTVSSRKHVAALGSQLSRF